MKVETMTTKQIWKFPIEPSSDARCVIQMPLDFRCLSVQMQRNQPMLYAMVDPATPTIAVHIEVYGTGWDIPDDPGRYLGTFMTGGDDGLVFHVFDGVVDVS